jgi:hypothetical protein
MKRPSKRLLAALGLGLCALACRSDPAPAPAAAGSGKPAKQPLDRLAPGELAPGSELAFGIPVPDGMRLTHLFHDVAYMNGNAPQDALVEYVRRHVGSDRVQLAQSSVVFPRVTINGQPQNRVYDIEVFSRSGRSRVTIRDVTPLPAPGGLTEAQRWERAGLSPSGELLDKDTLR